MCYSGDVLVTYQRGSKTMNAAGPNLAVPTMSESGRGRAEKKNQPFHISADILRLSAGSQRPVCRLPGLLFGPSKRTIFRRMVAALSSRVLLVEGCRYHTSASRMRVHC